MAADRRAAVVAPLGAALEVRLPTHPGGAGAVEQAAQQVVAEGSRLVAQPGARGDGGDRAAVLRLAEDRLVAPGPLVAAPLLDDEAEVHAAAAQDVLDRLAGPGAAVRHALAVQQLGHLGQGALGQLPPHAAHDGGLLGHDDQLAGVDEAAGGVAPAAVAERIVPPVPALLEEPPLEARHALGVEVALQLGGQAQLPVQVAAGGAVEAGAGQVGHQQRHLAALELVEQVEHQAGVAGQAREVVHGDRRHLARGQRPEEGLVAVARGAEAGLVPARVADHPDQRAGRQQCPTGGRLHLVAHVGGGRLLVAAAHVDEVLGHPSMNARLGGDGKAHHPVGSTAAPASAPPGSGRASSPRLGPPSGCLDARAASAATSASHRASRSSTPSTSGSTTVGRGAGRWPNRGGSASTAR